MVLTVRDVCVGVASLCAALINDISHIGQLKGYRHDFFVKGLVTQFWHIGQPSLNPSGSAKQTQRKGSKTDRSCLGLAQVWT